MEIRTLITADTYAGTPQWQTISFINTVANVFAVVFTYAPIMHECICLDIHHFCSFDNWQCDLISENWPNGEVLTLANVFLS